MTAYYCQVLADAGAEYCIVDASEHDVSLDHNANGSHYCNDCRCIVILFDDDTHGPDDCDAHKDCTPLELAFSLDGWWGRLNAGRFCLIVDGMEDVDFTLSEVDHLLIKADEDGESELPIEGEILWVSDIVTELYMGAESALCAAGYYVESNDGTAVYAPIVGAA